MSSWPKMGAEDLPYNKDRVTSLKEIVVAVRTIRSELNVAPTKKIDALISIKDSSDKSLFDDLKGMIMSLTNLESLNIKNEFR